VTTIAYKDGVLAADRQSNWGGGKAGFVRKIGRNKAGDLIGLTGDCASCATFLTWFEAGEQGEAPPMKVEDDDSFAMIARAGGALMLRSNRGVVELDAPYFAMGSGREYALGAMAHGAGAAAAVDIACRLDNSSGGGVDVLTLGPPTPEKLQRIAREPRLVAAD
jgi:ATP-dependent protease HslVU (ClpYQ) peptidase subunit